MDVLKCVLVKSSAESTSNMPNNIFNYSKWESEKKFNHCWIISPSLATFTVSLRFFPYKLLKKTDSHYMGIKYLYIIQFYLLIDLQKWSSIVFLLIALDIPFLHCMLAITAPGDEFEGNPFWRNQIEHQSAHSEKLANNRSISKLATLTFWTLFTILKLFDRHPHYFAIELLFILLHIHIHVYMYVQKDF